MRLTRREAIAGCGGALAWLYRSGEVLFRHDDETMAHLKVGLDPSELARFETHYPYRPQ